MRGVIICLLVGLAACEALYWALLVYHYVTQG